MHKMTGMLAQYYICQHLVAEENHHAARQYLVSLWSQNQLIQFLFCCKFSILSGPGVAVDLMSMPYPALEEEEEEEEDFTSSAD